MLPSIIQMLHDHHIMHNEINIIYIHSEHPRNLETSKQTSSSLKYGLSIGVPVVFAVLLMTAGILILYWAAKNGNHLYILESIIVWLTGKSNLFFYYY